MPKYFKRTIHLYYSKICDICQITGVVVDCCYNTHMSYHTREIADIYDALKTREHGLSFDESLSRLYEHGRNELPKPKRTTYAALFLSQFASPIIYVLLAAACVVIALGEIPDGIIILSVLLINALVGSYQEGRAQSALAAIQKLVQTKATVIRDAKRTRIDASEVVPGDIVVLGEGDKVPADGRLVYVNDLRIDESSLTGESIHIQKTTDRLTLKDMPVGDQKNMVFNGTLVVRGEGRCVVTATGLETVVGAISEQLSHIDTDVPLKQTIAKLSRMVLLLVALCAVGIFALGIYQGQPTLSLIETVIAISVSAIPEGLPVVVTVVLAIGVHRMAKKHALVKKLQAIEALGQVDVIAVDKTGTVTHNQMSVERVYVGGETYVVTGSGYAPQGEVHNAETRDVIAHVDHPGLLLAGRISAFLSGATVAFDEEKEQWERVSGDPTEAAMNVFAQKLGYVREDVLREHPMQFEIPFSSDYAYHLTGNTDSNGLFLSIAGAVERILAAAEYVWKDGACISLTAELRASIQHEIDMASKSLLRVIGLACHFAYVGDVIAGELPREMCFVGFVGIKDSIREEAKYAIQAAQRSGVRVVMITGDYSDTAQAIAQEVGIWNEGDGILTGKELAFLDEAALKRRLEKTSVFARVSPADKLRIIELYRSTGMKISMTGDGVNDALSLAAADLGVAMGKSGTEVARDAADLVLLDDNFGNIVAAIEEGRNIYRTVKKVVLYLFSTNIGEIGTIVAAMLLGLPIPLAASQIIWLNFVTDGFLVIALSLEPKDVRALKRDKKKQKHILDSVQLGRIALMSTVMMVGAISIFVLSLPYGFLYASTMTLTLLAVFQWFNAWNCRNEVHSVFSRHIASNVYLIGAMIAVALLQIVALSWAPLSSLLKLTPLGIDDWILIIGIGFSIVLVEEIRKLILRIHSTIRS